MAAPHHLHLFRRPGRTSALLVGLALTFGGVGPALATTAMPEPPPVGGPLLTGTTPLADVPLGVPQPPQLAAASYLLADLRTGMVLAAKAPHARALPASALKTLTALTVVPLLSPAQRYTAVSQDVVDGSKVGMTPGSSYTVQQMLHAMMLSSGNDAATGLARAAGGVPQTVALMQEQARALGAFDTVVKDPSGLDAPGQTTSSYDLALIARAALKLPEIRQLVTTRRARFPGKSEPGKVRPSYEIQNHNSLLANYPGAIGVKNGYTVAARWTIVGAATRGDQTYVVTALTRTDRSWRPTAALLDWAFAYGKQARPIGHLVEPGERSDPAELGAPTGRAPGDALAAARAPMDAAARTPLRTWVGAGGLGSAALVVSVLGLSARARRRQLRAARAARYARLRRP